jgi:AraC-like DNA-binding protein
VRFSTADYAPRERLDAWREIYGRTLHKLEIEPLAADDVEVDATLRRMPGLAIMTGLRSAAIYRREGAYIDHDDVVVTVGLSSGFAACQLGRTSTMRCGEAIVLTGTEPGHVTIPARGAYISLRVPLRELSPLVADLAAGYGRVIPADSPALQLLIRYIGILGETDAFSVPSLGRQAVTHVHDLVGLVIGATPDAAEVARRRGARAARLAAIRADIAENIDRNDLSVTEVAARHRCTPRYIQILFGREGTTFSDYVLEQRLARAYRRLIDPRRAAEKISSIAYDAGFADLSYFNRTFRRRYGARPSDIRAQNCGDDR